MTDVLSSLVVRYGVLPDDADWVRRHLAGDDYRADEAALAKPGIYVAIHVGVHGTGRASGIELWRYLPVPQGEIEPALMPFARAEMKALDCVFTDELPKPKALLWHEIARCGGKLRAVPR